MATAGWSLVPARLGQRELRGLSLVALLACWQGLSLWLQWDLLPGPAALAGRFWQEMHSGEFVLHFAATLQRVTLGFALSMCLGVCAGLAMARSKVLDALLDVPLTVLLNLPALIVIILCLLWIGLNEYSVVAAVVINKTPTVAVAMREGGRAVDPDLLAVARAFRLSRWRTLWQVYLPQLYPYLLAAGRTGLALVWKIVLVVELLGCSDGIGFQLGIYFQYFDIEGILTYALGFVALVLLLESRVIQRWEQRVMEWRQ